MKITACMMVKDEAAVLDRCLSSLQGLVDELVVVDTGSTDRTMEIAESHGAKVYHHPWEDNFALHRNQSISYATGDWVFIIDADECVVLSSGTTPEMVRRQIEAAAQSPEKVFNCLSVPLRDFNAEGVQTMIFNTPRFFRRGEVKYVNRVHNRPEVGGGFTSVLQGIDLHHHGYREDVMVEKDKRARTIGLLKRVLVDGEEGEFPDARFYLCQSYQEAGDFETALQYGEQYLEKKDQLGNLFNNSVFMTIATAAMALNDASKAQQYITLGLRAVPDDLDLLALLCEFGIWVGNPDYVTLAARKYFLQYEKYTEDPTLRGNRFCFSHNPAARAYIAYNYAATLARECVQAFDWMDVRLAGLEDGELKKSLGASLSDLYAAAGLQRTLPVKGPQVHKYYLFIGHSDRYNGPAPNGR